MRRPPIERLLPEVMQRTVGLGTPLDAFLDIMAAMQGSAADSLDRIEQMFDGSVRGVLQKPGLAGGHGMLVMCDVTEP